MEIYDVDEIEITSAASEAEYQDFMTKNIKRLKNMEATVEAIYMEEKNLRARRTEMEERLQKAKEWIGIHLGVGNRFECGAGVLSWRTSKAVKVTGEVPEQYCRYKKIVEVNKEAIAEDLAAGAQLTFAEFETRNNLQVK